MTPNDSPEQIKQQRGNEAEAARRNGSERAQSPAGTDKKLNGPNRPST